MSDDARPADVHAQVDQLLVANRYLTLATADEDGRPWATPVWFARHGDDAFCWVSKPGARHSRNLASREQVALVVFDSSRPESEAAAVYVEATAGEVPAADRADVLAAYNARSTKLGLPEWTESDVTGSARHRLYRARAHATYVLDEHDERIPVG